MNIQAVQLILLAFALLMLYVIYLHWRKNEISIRMFLAWILIWGVFILIDVYPKLIEPYINEIFKVKVMDWLMIMAFMVLSYITIENRIAITRYEKQLEILVRKIAIKKTENGKQ